MQYIINKMELFTVSFNEFNEYFWRNNYKNYSIDISSINEPINLINKIKELYRYIVLRRNFDYFRFFLKDEDTFSGKYLLVSWNPRQSNIINLGFSYLDDYMKRFIVTNNEISIDDNRVRVVLIQHDIHNIDILNSISNDRFILDNKSLYLGNIYDSPISFDNRIGHPIEYTPDRINDLVEILIKTSTKVDKIKFIISYYSFDSNSVYLRCNMSDYPVQYNHYSLLLSAIK